MPTRCRVDALKGASVNAFITLHPEHVLDAARARLGLLHGLPIPLKDSVNTHDYPTTAGTPALRYFRPREDAPLVPTLRAEGAIVLGRNNMHELARDYTSNNQAYGAVHNPHDPSRIPGGSSGGTAASISYRMAPLGVAEDTAGSIRVPAALCGIAGFGRRRADIRAPESRRPRRCSISSVRTPARSRICCRSIPRSPALRSLLPHRP